MSARGLGPPGWLAVGWVLAALAVGWRRRPPERLTALRPRSPRRRLPPRFRRLLVPAALALVVGAFVPAAAPIILFGAWTADIRRRRAVTGRRAASVAESLPEAVDLLALAVGAGLTVPLAVAAVGRRGEGPVAAGLARVAAEAASGRRCADSLEDLPGQLGESVRPLVTVLVAAERYGAPLGASLERLASEVRDDRRRRAEASARRVPVKLLFPLVCCVLPAFALLTVVPMLAGAFQALRR